MTVTRQKVTQIKVQVQPLSSDNKKRIGLLGGTFNPIHNGHLLIAEQVRSQLNLDKVLFMPDNMPPHVDQKEAIDAKKRLKMVQLAVMDNKHFGVEELELKRGGVSYTYDTLKELQLLHPENEYYFIIGGDMVAYLPKWYRIDELVKMVKFVGVQRPGYRQQSQYPVLWVDVPKFDISSSLIRQKIVQGGSIKYLVPDAVAEYIRKEGLYRE